jgi:hypothetical protein
MAAVSWVGAGVAAGAQALKTRTPKITKLSITALLLIRLFFCINYLFKVVIGVTRDLLLVVSNDVVRQAVTAAWRL